MTLLSKNRRLRGNAIRAQRAAERKAFEDSFSYEDDLKRERERAAAEATTEQPTASEPSKTTKRNR